MDLNTIVEKFTIDYISGRYLLPNTLEDFLKDKRNVTVVGKSVQGRSIFQYTFGNGATRLLMWSQMHGNESTTTKAVLDLINYLESAEAKELKDKFTICILPMLNPDGAVLWTRNNANEVDLNRDAQNLTQIESRVLRKVIDNFSPDLCLNLHDQRTIFGLRQTSKPATISFLSPSYNPQKDINAVRLTAMKYITIMSATLQKYISGQVGRFDDSFNINCIGDTLQYQNIPTILIEAGHFADDYQRDITRGFVFLAILELLFNWDIKKEEEVVRKEYFDIPQNEKIFFDLIYRNVQVSYENIKIITNFAVQMSEVVVDEQLQFIAKIVQIGNLDDYFGHQEFDLKAAQYFDNKNNKPEIGQEANFTIGNIVFKNGLPTK